jgi:hypothetical protein
LDGHRPDLWAQALASSAKVFNPFGLRAKRQQVRWGDFRQRPVWTFQESNMAVEAFAELLQGA